MYDFAKARMWKWEDAKVSVVTSFYEAFIQQNDIWKI